MAVTSAFSPISLPAAETQSKYFWGKNTTPIDQPTVVDARAQGDTCDMRRLRFGQNLILKVINLEKIVDTSRAPNLSLVIDEVRLDFIKAYSINGSEVRFRFDIDESDLNDPKVKESIAILFGSINPKTQLTKAVSVSMYDSIRRKVVSTAVTTIHYYQRSGDSVRIFPVTDEALGDIANALNLVVATQVRFWTITSVCLLLLIAMLLVLVKSDFLRGPASKSADESIVRGPFSLAKTQFAFWSIIVFFSSIYLWMLTGTYHPIPTTILGVIAISTGTSLLARTIDERQGAAPVGAHGNQGLSRLPGLPKLLRDILTDYSGRPSIPRAQLVLWNFAFGCYYVTRIYQTADLPDFDATLVTLLGLSSTGYLGGKALE
jgi:hypothetical protein